ARANQPPALSTAPAAAGGNAGPASAVLASSSAPAVPGRMSETTNYEVGRLTRHTVSPQGSLARLSVAVLLDDERVTTRGENGAAQTTTRPWEPQGIQRIQGLVAAAVGLDPARGDQLTVENITFEAPQPEPDAPPVPMSQQAIDTVKEYWPSAL